MIMRTAIFFALSLLPCTAGVIFDLARTQTYDADLEAIGNVSTNGIITRTGAGTAATRTITGTAGEITVTNGDGVSGNPTIELAATITQATTFDTSTTSVLVQTDTTGTPALTIQQEAGVAHANFWAGIRFNGTNGAGNHGTAGFAGNFGGDGGLTINPSIRITDSTTTAGGGTLVFMVAATGNIDVYSTVTAGATTGAQTINRPAGSVNFAAAATSLLVTNSLVTSSSIIFVTVATNDTTMKGAYAVAGSGSFTIYAEDAPTAETRVNFLVLN